MSKRAVRVFCIHVPIDLGDWVERESKRMGVPLKAVVVTAIQKMKDSEVMARPRQQEYMVENDHVRLPPPLKRQFIDSFRASGYTVEEVAAAMGQDPAKLAPYTVGQGERDVTREHLTALERAIGDLDDAKYLGGAR